MDKSFVVNAIKQSGISLAKIEKLSGVKKTAMEQWIYVKAVPSFDRAMAVLKALGYEISITKR